MNKKWFHGIRANMRPFHLKSGEEMFAHGERISPKVQTYRHILDGGRGTSMVEVRKARQVCEPVVNRTEEAANLIHTFVAENHE
ncbi:hypothetical protein JAAARDRAFT_702494 [Jaapia argillacea MUCL 33604]|uniref:Uncharacterized protein n=1 Tax=Jaapia argillacea MUCL 33604 TaxID=933084 RepID=A0A067PCW3_9AGAM|nr:hypothetical protein JAAARDRAFT_702494 [Jaapia argillacea MUCL 33604]